MSSIRLGVNIDHVATVRNARGESYPSPLRAALLAQKNGADSVTIHLREDRRHIKDIDAKKICSIKGLLVNLEVSTNPSMIKNALKIRPNFICIVPENRKEITTEGGLNLKKNKNKIKDIIIKLKKNNIRTSLFIEPKITDVKLASDIYTDCIELHTGKYCNLFNKNFNTIFEFKKLKNATMYAKKLGLEVHAGHGLTYKSAKKISKIKGINELNIGHFIISESLFIGLKNVIKRFKTIIRLIRLIDSQYIVVSTWRNFFISSIALPVPIATHCNGKSAIDTGSPVAYRKT